MTDTESRIGRVVDLLARLAMGDLTARGVRSDLDDDIDAVIEGINMLAEDLEASRAELEERVRIRTLELEMVNTDVLRLAELGNLLAACETAEEAYAMTSHGLASMFENLSGAMYLYRASRNLLEPQSTWGELGAVAPFDPRECWALRRGHTHFVDLDAAVLSCPHVIERTGRSVCVPMSAHGETLGMLLVMGHASSTTGMVPLTAQKRQLVGPVAEQVSLALANIELREKLRTQALRDPLTGLYNRRFADEWIDQEAARADRAGHSVGVMMADIDHFKQVNDVHGHEAGDVLLVAVADALSGSLRAEDTACRYGGEEFLILISDIDADTLHERAELLRRRVADLRVSYRGEMLPPVTLSLGVALYPEHGDSAQTVVKAADAALYAAKRDGRNRTQSA